MALINVVPLATFLGLILSNTALLDYEFGEIDCPDRRDEEIFSPKYWVPLGVPFRAWRTLPYTLFTIRQSSIPQAGMGVFANTFIPKNTWLGEYEGELLGVKEGENAEEDDEVEYMWDVMRGDETSHYVDAGKPETSNWLRFINCARHRVEESVDMHMCYGRVEYRTKNDIAPGQELFVYYGDGYAMTNLNISLGFYHNDEFACELYDSCPDGHVYAKDIFKDEEPEGDFDEPEKGVLDVFISAMQSIYQYCIRLFKKLQFE